MCWGNVRHHESSDGYRGWEGRGWDRVEKLQVFSGGGQTDPPAPLQQGEPGGTKIQLISTTSLPVLPLQSSTQFTDCGRPH